MKEDKAIEAGGEKPLEKAHPQKEEKPAEKREDLRQIVRLTETNLNGKKPVRQAIRNIKGVSFMFSNAISVVYKHPDKKLGALTETELKELEDIIINPQKYGIPEWLYNRRSDPATGQSGHLAVSKLTIRNKLDVDDLKKIRTYRGIRHGLGLPVRGQRTRSSFRKGKTVGVKRKKRG
ncbi:MAG: 30S ribosomal protein S13 [Nanoarchaeota archaeon]|nr:30S ribosomal protein S13 [Nanoarchaeota archaeon]MBU1135273.1 30S ribosomal protein S13 [Nanoarchaeota archaeon]MBU2519877.1 30S ribosomal protein S13 [Nanoarchaeota archaeon]